MNAKTVLCMALLEGRVLNVNNCFKEVGYTNIGREIPRVVEDVFGVEVSRTPKTGKNRYGDPVSYTNYRLNASQHNEKGMAEMQEYILKNGGTLLPPKRPVGRPKEKETKHSYNSNPLF